MQLDPRPQLHRLLMVADLDDPESTEDPSDQPHHRRGHQAGGPDDLHGQLLAGGEVEVGEAEDGDDDAGYEEYD